MKNFLILILIAQSTILSSQFWSEDFADGIPSEWEIEENSNIAVSWSYCQDTTMYSTGDDTTCPHDYNDFFNGFQTHFKSDTPENGYATCVLQPFWNELESNPFTITLTTDAKDCSAYGTVFISFNSHIGVFRTNASESVQLRVSTDKKTWASYFHHSTLLATGGPPVPGTQRWSKNPTKVEFDISDIAAGEKEVFIQWSWTGKDEYHWSIDDVALSAESSLEEFDLSLAPLKPFQAIMPNFQTPVSQIDTAYFLTDIGNLGTQSQTDILVTAQVLDEANNILYSEVVEVAQLDAGEILEDVSFKPYFHTAGIGEFNITYNISSEVQDAKIGDNFFEYPFQISESKFSKNEPADLTVDLFPTILNPQGDLEPNWAIANHFYIPNGGNYFLDEVYFEIPNFSDLTINGEMYLLNDPDITVQVLLYEWNNDPDFNFAPIEEYSAVGLKVFTVTGADGISENIIKLGNLKNQDNPDANIPLKNDQHYFLAMDYSQPVLGVRKLFTVKANNQLDYDATIHAHEIQGRQRFASMSKTGRLNRTYDTFSFGGNLIPHIGFSITQDEGVSTNQVFVTDGLRISPSPADKVAQIKFNVNIQENDVLELIDINGRLIKTVQLTQGQHQYNLDCSYLSNANYLLTYKSEKVISTTKLIVLH